MVGFWNDLWGLQLLEEECELEHVGHRHVPGQRIQNL